jgi:hypothetical protein
MVAHIYFITTYYENYFTNLKTGTYLINKDLPIHVTIFCSTQNGQALLVSDAKQIDRAFCPF